MRIILYRDPGDLRFFTSSTAEHLRYQGELPGPPGKDRHFGTIAHHIGRMTRHTDETDRGRWRRRPGWASRNGRLFAPIQESTLSVGDTGQVAVERPRWLGTDYGNGEGSVLGHLIRLRRTRVEHS